MEHVPCVRVPWVDFWAPYIDPMLKQMSWKEASVSKKYVNLTLFCLPTLPRESKWLSSLSIRLQGLLVLPLTPD